MPPAVREFDADGDGEGPVLAQGVGPHQADDLGPLVLLLRHGLTRVVWKSAGPAAPAGVSQPRSWPGLPRGTPPEGPAGPASVRCRRGCRPPAGPPLRPRRGDSTKADAAARGPRA